MWLEWSEPGREWDEGRTERCDRQSVWAEETTWAFALSEVGAMEGPEQRRA